MDGIDKRIADILIAAKAIDISAPLRDKLKGIITLYLDKQIFKNYF